MTLTALGVALGWYRWRLLRQGFMPSEADRTVVRAGLKVVIEMAKYHPFNDAQYDTWNRAWADTLPEAE